MPFRPFQSEFADQRVVMIPSGLNDDRRTRFITKIAAAVRQQATLAAKSDRVLNVTGEIQERGDRIVIPHEPAVPGDPAALESPADLPDIDVVWWLSWSLVGALKAAAVGTPHGGIQIGTLYLDQGGRVKLGDFGIAPVFEAICGLEARRQIHCDAAVHKTDTGRTSSGTWSLLSEDATREQGWIAPYFAHELLEGTLRLNPKSDQFAAGTLLFLLAIGTHPYGANLADPTLMFYFHLEPFAIREERPEWEEVFQRHATGISTTSDRPTLAWSDFVQKLLHNDPGERYANPAEADVAVGEFAPSAWAEASAAITASLKLLDTGEVETFLQKVAPWKDNEALPALWREQLSSWVADVDSRKEEIGAHKRIERRLAEGQQALHSVEVERAREIGREVLASPACDDALRAAAEELIEFCDEQEQFIQSGADDLAQAYLQSARECLGRGQLDEARQLLDGLLHDPATPGARAGQARELLAEVELTEQRIEQQLAELNGTAADLQAGRYEAARQRLEALLEEENLPEKTAAQARALLEEVAQAQARRAACAAALDAARTAWERADLEALKTHLAQVPEDFSDPEIADVRADLASRCGPLRSALECRAAAEKSLAADDVEAALADARRARGASELPQILRDQLDALVERCQSIIEEQEKERIERIVEQLRKAQAACEALRIDECRQTLDDEVIKQPRLPENVAHQAEDLLRTCERVEAARSLFEHVRQHLADRSFDEAFALLDGLDTKGLPPAVADESGQLRAEATQARKEHVKRERQKLAERLDQIEGLLQAGRLGEAETLLKQAEASPHLTTRLRERIAPLRATLEKQRPILEAILAVDAALSPDVTAPLEAVAPLERLPAELPPWAENRVAELRQRATELADRRRLEAIRQATAALDAAQAALDSGDVPTGRGQLERARGALELDPSLAERYERLAALAAQLDEWLPRVRAASETLERGDLAGARRELSGLLGQEAMPALCRTQLADLSDRTEQLIAARQTEIDAELSTLAERLERRGRRVRRFPERVGALQADSLATARHQSVAGELRRRYEELPEPKLPRVPLVVAACFAAIAVIFAGLYIGGVFGGGADERDVAGPGIAEALTQVQEPKPSPAGPPAATVVEPPSEEPPTITPPTGETPVAEDDARAQMAAALARLRAELAETAAQAEAEGRLGVDWQLVFEPADRLPATLLAIDSAGEVRKEMGAAASATELERLRLPAELRDELFPLPPPPSVAERIAAAVERLQAEVDTAGAEVGRREAPAPRFVVRLEPPDRVPTTLIAQNEQTQEELTLGTVEEDGLDGLALTDEWRQRLYPPPPSEPEKPSLAEVARTYLDELQQALSGAVVGQELVASTDGTFEVVVQWGGRDLLPFTGLRFDEEAARLEPPVASAAAHFSLQIAALETLSEPIRISVARDEDADAGAPHDEYLVRISGQASDVAITGVDSSASRVRLKTAARIAADPRPEASFPLIATRTGETFALANAGARAAFHAYLRGLQEHRLADSLREIRRQLQLPTAMRLSAPADFAGGSRVTLRVQGTDDRTFAAIDATWEPRALLYESDAEQAVAVLREGVRAAAQEDAVRAELAAAWPSVRSALAPPADQPGMRHFGRCDLLRLTLGSDQPDEPLAVAVQVTIGPPGGVAQEQIEFPARLTAEDGKLAWDLKNVREAKATIVARLQALTRSEELRARRCQETLAQLAGELGVERRAISVQAEGDELRAEVGPGGRQRIFTWTWDRSDLRYANRVESTPPPLSLDGKLEQLALAPVADIDAFVDALTEVTQAKIGRYGVSGYTLADDFTNAADPGAGLVAVSTAFQKLVATTPARDPFPVLFIEYFVGETDVYGLVWRAVTNEADVIVGVADARVWRVMPTAELQRYSTPEAFRHDYSTNAELGERLLGRALGEALVGSARPGGGSWGLAIAPDGLLWLTRWEQVRFNPRSLRSVDLRGTADPGPVTTLRQLLEPAPLGQRGLAWRHAGVWCVPALAGQWRGAADQIDEFQLGVLVSGKKANVLSFIRHDYLTFSAVDDPTLAGDFGWPRFADTVRREEIGYLFWNRRWGDERWSPTSFTSFSLIQIP